MTQDLSAMQVTDVEQQDHLPRPQEPPRTEAERTQGDENAGSGLVELAPILEALLLVVDEPITDVALAEVIERPRAEIAAALAELAAEYTQQQRGFQLREVAAGWRLYTRQEYAPYVEKYIADGQHTRLTQAALETLAVVAYRQPVSRSKVSGIRGVNCDGVMRTLVGRGLVIESGVEQGTGAHLYSTTGLLLEKLGISSIEELPAIAPLLPDMDSLDDVIDRA